MNNDIGQWFNNKHVDQTLERAQLFMDAAEPNQQALELIRSLQAIVGKQRKDIRSLAEERDKLIVERDQAREQSGFFIQMGQVVHNDDQAMNDLLGNQELRTWPLQLKTALKGALQDARRKAAQSPVRDIIYQPQLPFAAIGTQQLSQADLEVECLKCLLPTIITFDAKILSATSVSAPRQNNQAGNKLEYQASGSYFNELWCRNCFPNSRMESAGFWKFRRGFGRDGPVIFQFKVYKCPQCQKATGNDDNNGISDSRFQHLMQYAVPQYVREMCPVVLSHQVCFTKEVLLEVLETSISRSNITELSRMLRKRYNEMHLQRVTQLITFIAEHRQRARVQIDALNKKGHSLRGVRTPDELVSALRTFTDRMYFKQLTNQPVLPSPSVQFLRDTVLKPNLSAIHPFASFLMEKIPRTKVLSLDSTYQVADIIVDNATSAKVFRSVYLVMNQFSQVIDCVFTPSDSYLSIQPFLTNVANREITGKQDSTPTVFYTDKCCADEQLLTGAFKNKGGVVVKLDLFHFQRRFMINGALRLSGHAKAAEHRKIFAAIKEEIQHRPSNIQQNRFEIRGGTVLAMAIEDRLWRLCDTDESVKEIVNGKKFQARLTNNMIHIKKGCLSDEKGVPLYFQNGRSKEFCCRGTNKNELTHRMINSLVVSCAKMTPEFTGMLMSFLIYHINFDRGVERSNEFDIPHVNPLTLRSAFLAFHGLFGGLDNPFDTMLHHAANKLLSGEVFPEPTEAHFNQYLNVVVNTMRTSAGETLQQPVAGWPDFQEYQRVAMKAFSSELRPGAAFCPNALPGKDEHLRPVLKVFAEDPHTHDSTPFNGKYAVSDTTIPKGTTPRQTALSFDFTDDAREQLQDPTADSPLRSFVPNLQQDMLDFFSSICDLVDGDVAPPLLLPTNSNNNNNNNNDDDDDDDSNTVGTFFSDRSFENWRVHLQDTWYDSRTRQPPFKTAHFVLQFTANVIGAPIVILRNDGREAPMIVPTQNLHGARVDPRERVVIVFAQFTPNSTPSQKEATVNLYVVGSVNLPRDKREHQDSALKTIGHTSEQRHQHRHHEQERRRHNNLFGQSEATTTTAATATTINSSGNRALLPGSPTDSSNAPLAFSSTPLGARRRDRDATPTSSRFGVSTTQHHDRPVSDAFIRPGPTTIAGRAAGEAYRLAVQSNKNNKAIADSVRETLIQFNVHFPPGTSDSTIVKQAKEYYDHTKKKLPGF